MAQVCVHTGGTVRVRARSGVSKNSSIKVYKRTVRASADRVTLVVKPSNAARKRLERGKTVRVRFDIFFDPVVGSNVTKTTKMHLIQRPTPARFRKNLTPNRQSK